jgi:hypothetical protein
MKRNVVLWWIPAIAIALLALAEGAVHTRPHQAARPLCATRELVMDVAGDGHAAKVQLTRVGDDAWADVLVDGNLQSTTRIGAWRDDSSLEAIDVNADGRADLVRRYDDNGKRVAEVWISDGTAFAPGWRGPSETVCIAQR